MEAEDGSVHEEGEEEEPADGEEEEPADGEEDAEVAPSPPRAPPKARNPRAGTEGRKRPREVPAAAGTAVGRVLAQARGKAAESREAKAREDEALVEAAEIFRAKQAAKRQRVSWGAGAPSAASAGGKSRGRGGRGRAGGKGRRGRSREAEVDDENEH